jgi:acyl carrier protein
MEQEIRELIQRTLADHQLPSVLDASFDLVEQGSVDSLGLLSLATAIERHFGLPLADHEWTLLRSIASIQALIEERRQPSPQPA